MQREWGINISNFHVIADSPDTTEIVSEVSSRNVAIRCGSLNEISDISFDNLIIRGKEDSGIVPYDGICIMYCDNVKVTNCNLYWFGHSGIRASRLSTVITDGLYIYDCDIHNIGTPNMPILTGGGGVCGNPNSNMEILRTRFSN